MPLVEFNGKVIEFPEGTTPDAIRGALTKKSAPVPIDATEVKAAISELLQGMRPQEVLIDTGELESFIERLMDVLMPQEVRVNVEVEDQSLVIDAKDLIAVVDGLKDALASVKVDVSEVEAMLTANSIASEKAAERVYRSIENLIEAGPKVKRIQVNRKKVEGTKIPLADTIDFYY